MRMAHARAGRNSPTGTPADTGRSPRPGTPRRQAHGSAGNSFWENIPGEQCTRPLEDVDFYGLDPVLPPQTHQLGVFLAGQTHFGASVDVGVADPVPQA